MIAKIRSLKIDRSSLRLKMTLEKRPKLIGFDLDYTLWPFWVDTHVDPPFHKDKNGKVVDSRNVKINFYKEVPKVLQKLHSEGCILAAVSRTTDPEGANQLLELWDWDRFFTYKEIYPGRKTTHFQRIKEASGLEYREMLFFDDEERNKIDLNTIGVLTIMVPDGVTEELVKQGLVTFSNKN
ncbi:magnesium-dependent phosphatase 1-like [Panulirus ornatus]|uniref:magnesium-dependent phosphatase 1-like n=1 Tax=Panulirus ornatus TaxID=150431 RepID=UPI003A838227